MRFIAIFPFLCAVVALTLSLLCVFAGSKPGYIEDADILTLNISMLGHTAINASSSSSSLLNSIESSIKGDLNNAITNFARSLGIHDFYSAHLLDYCEGYYAPVALANSTSHPNRNVTKCSNHTALFHFDPTSIIQKELKPGVSLQNLHWPSAIQDGLRTLEAASKVMVILYYVGIAVTGLAIIGSIIAIVTGGTLSAIVNLMLAIIAFLVLGIASGIVTVMVVKATNMINQHGNDIGIAAYKGRKFLAMTWVATAVMLVAAIAWIADCCVGRRNRTTYIKEGREGRL
ncbi:MAG: hypothetical protein M1830_001589 [Pleopsidium flavum]|nr:MAG: hypothetical protein M1830_001589 [Pleopsidium flavum]